MSTPAELPGSIQDAVAALDVPTVIAFTGNPSTPWRSTVAAISGLSDALATCAHMPAPIRAALDDSVPIPVLPTGQLPVPPSASAYTLPAEHLQLLAHTAVTVWLEHAEQRVRRAAVQALGICAWVMGRGVLDQALASLWAAVELNIDGTAARDSSAQVPLPAGDAAPGDAPPPPLHDTAGWSTLEWGVLGLRALLLGLGPRAFMPEPSMPALASDPRVAELLLVKGTAHVNRFVRQAAHCTAHALVAVAAQAAEVQGKHIADILEELSLLRPLLTVTQTGMSGNWSQVRYASSGTAQRILLDVRRPGNQQMLYTMFLPRVALNRHYVAAGVRQIACDTWAALFPPTAQPDTAGHSVGSLALASCWSAAVEYFLVCTRADNHAVREAAFTMLAQAARALPGAVVEPTVPAILAALDAGMRDASWPVRDTAAVAAGRIAAQFPASTTAAQAGLLTLWLQHCWDNIPSVRQHAAEAIGAAIKCWPRSALDAAAAWADEHLLRVQSQPAQATAFGGLENVTQFGVAPPRADSPMDSPRSPRVERHVVDPKHSDATLFSCGSLAPKLSRGCGCMDHGFVREQEPWEATDGALWLAVHVVVAAPAEWLPVLLPKFVEVARTAPEFTAAHTLRTTLWSASTLLILLCKQAGTEQAMTQLAADACAEVLRATPHAGAAAAQFLHHLGRIQGLDALLAGHTAAEQRAIRAACGTPAAAGVNSVTGAPLLDDASALQAAVNPKRTKPLPRPKFSLKPTTSA